MPDDARPSRLQLSEAVGALGWRLVLGAFHAAVIVPSLSRGAEVVAIAAEAAGPTRQEHLAADVRADRAMPTNQDDSIPRKRSSIRWDEGPRSGFSRWMLRDHSAIAFISTSRCLTPRHWVGYRPRSPRD